MSTGLERIAAKARQEPQLRFTSLAHHLDAARLWRNLCHVPHHTAPGSDGQTVDDLKQEFVAWSAATLRAVAPGISEALITTAAGLFVAVPAVVAYNQFAARIRVFASAADDFARELLNSLEEIPARTSAQQGPEDFPREAERGVYK